MLTPLSDSKSSVKYVNKSLWIKQQIGWKVPSSIKYDYKTCLPHAQTLKLEEKKKERRLHVDNRGVNLIMKEVSVSCQMINKVNEKPFFGNGEKKSFNGSVERPRFSPPSYSWQKEPLSHCPISCAFCETLYSCPKIEI